MSPADRSPRPQSPPGYGLRRNTTHVVQRELKTGTLGTATKKDTVNAALREVTALAARRRDLQRLTSRGLPDLEDEGVTRAAWRR